VIFLICQLLYIGYSIHGNESSGTGAIALAYPRCCRKSRAEKTLENIILLDLLFLTQTDYTFPHG
jgi:hypothetical protein